MKEFKIINIDMSTNKRKKTLQRKKKKTLYNLELHETLVTKFGIVIMRVPSGWIYDCWDKETDSFKTGVFVPFDTTFQVW